MGGLRIWAICASWFMGVYNLIIETDFEHDSSALRQNDGILLTKGHKIVYILLPTK